VMSAVGFAPLPPQDSELEKLRETCKRLNYAIRAIKEAQECLAKMNIGDARKSLSNATWQAREAKKTLAEVGRAKKTNTSSKHHR
jgi:hypothetical protein